MEVLLRDGRLTAEEVLDLNDAIIEEEVTRVHVAVDDLLLDECLETPMKKICVCDKLLLKHTKKDG